MGRLEGMTLFDEWVPRCLGRVDADGRLDKAWDAGRDKMHGR